MDKTDVEICAFVYSLCEQRNLPVLVTDLIAGYLDERDLLSLSNLSRALHCHANSIIYRNIDLDLTEPETSGRKALLLFRTLLTNRIAASSIRSLSLTGDVLENWRFENHYHEMVHIRPIEEPFRGQTPPTLLLDVSDFEPREIELYRNPANLAPADTSSSDPQISNDTQISLSWLCASIIGLIPHLQDLHIDSDYFRYPDFRSNLRNFFESKHLQNLRSTNFCLDLVDDKGRHIHVTAVRDWDEILLQPFLQPKIECISTLMTLAKDKLSQLRISPVTRLILYHCQVEASDLNALLAATPNLRYLEYHASIDDHWCREARENDSNEHRNLGLEALYVALRHISDNLQELHTSVEFDDDGFEHFRGYSARHDLFSLQKREELSTLRRLHALTISYPYFLGFDPQALDTYEWSKILPASLRQITLIDDLADEIKPNQWSAENLMPIIASLLEWMANNPPGTQPLKFELILRNLESEIIFPAALGILDSLCDRHGVRVKCWLMEPGESFSKIPGHHGVHEGAFTCVLPFPSEPVDPEVLARQVELNRRRLEHIR